jgi:hypothetical protein
MKTRERENLIPADKPCHSFPVGTAQQPLFFHLAGMQAYEIDPQGTKFFEGIHKLTQATRKSVVAKRRHNRRSSYDNQRAIHLAPVDALLTHSHLCQRTPEQFPTHAAGSIGGFGQLEFFRQLRVGKWQLPRLHKLPRRISGAGSTITSILHCRSVCTSKTGSAADRPAEVHLAITSREICAMFPCFRGLKLTGDLRGRPHIAATRPQSRDSRCNQGNREKT